MDAMIIKMVCATVACLISLVVYMKNIKEELGK